MPDVADAVWLPAVGDAIRSVTVRPVGDGVQVTLTLAGPAALLAADVVEQHVRPRVERMWQKVPRRAQELCRAVADAQAGLCGMRGALRAAEVDADLKSDTGLPADQELARAIDLRHRITVRKAAVKALRERAQAAVAQAARDLKHLTAMARAEVLQETAGLAQAAWEKLARAVAGPLEELVQAKAAWAGVVGSVDASADRLADLLPELPPAPPEERHVVVPEELRGRHGFIGPGGVFVEADELPRPKLEHVPLADPARVARVAADLNYQSVAGYEDAGGRFVVGPPPAPGERSRPPVPSYDNTLFPKPGAAVPNDVAKEADRLAEELMAEAEVLPAADPLPQPQPLPVAPPLPGDEEDPPKRRRR